MVCPWLNHKTSIIVIYVFHCCPCSNNSVLGPERKIMKILMKWMTRCLGVVNGLVDA